MNLFFIRSAKHVFFLLGFMSVWVHVEGAPRKSESSSIHVASFNIRYLNTRDKGELHWDVRKERVMTAIRHLEADILGLQEAFFSQIRDMQPALVDYHRVGVGRRDGKEEGETCSICFRKERFELMDHGTFWLSDTPELPGSVTWGNKVVRICTWARLMDRRSEESLYVFNTHFDHVSQESREQAARLVAQRIAGREHEDSPVMLLGDLNAAENNPAVRYLKGEAVVLDGGEAGPETYSDPLVDTFRVHHPDADEVRTGHGFRGETAGAKIDYVMVSSDVTVLDAEIDRTRFDGMLPSDHYPVRATVTLRPNPFAKE